MGTKPRIDVEIKPLTDVLVFSTQTQIRLIIAPCYSEAKLLVTLKDLKGNMVKRWPSCQIEIHVEPLNQLRFLFWIVDNFLDSSS